MLSDFENYGEFQENYRYAHDFWAPFVKSAQISTLGASGYTWSDNELKAFEKEGREPIEYNIMRRPLQFFSGYLRDNLHSVVVSPVEGSDQQTADQFTELQYYIWNKGKGYSTFLDASDEGMKSGISLCGVQMDYTKDFVNGDISFFKRTYNSFYLDPTFENIDLTDCGFAITRDLIEKNTVKSLLPYVDPQVIDDIQGAFRDDKFLSYHPNFTTLSRNRNLLAYDQYYKRTNRERKFLVDEKSGYYRDITDLSSEEIKKLENGIYRLRKLYEEAEDASNLPPMLSIRNVERPFIELSIMLNGQRVYCGEDHTGITDTYPFRPIVCYMEPSIWMPSQRLQGLSQTLWSAQREFNKRHMKITNMMDTQIATGYKYLIGSVDPEDLQQSGQNRIVGIDPENAPQGLDSVQELSGGTASPALFEYQNILDQLTLTLANVNESVLGIDDKGNTQISGRLAEVRIGQGLRSNRKIFDHIETAQLELGNLVLKAIQANYPSEKVQRILGEEPTQQFYEKEFEQYDAVLKEGVRSKTQRDALYYEYVNLKRDGLVDIPESAIVDMLPSSGGNTDLQEVIQKRDEQRQQEQARQTQLQDTLIEADIDEKRALANERRTRADSNEGLRIERASEAVQNEAQAVLDRAKAITEIADMRTDNLLRVMDFVRNLDAETMQNMESVNQEVEQRSDEEDKEKQDAQAEVEMIADSMQSEGANPLG